MTVPELNMYTRFNFSLNREGTSEDIAVFGIWIALVADATNWDAFLSDQASAAYHAWASTITESHFTTAVTLQSTECIHYNAAGHTLNEQNFVTDTPWQGTGSGASLPWETSLAVSLYTYPRGTFVQNGRRKRGRFYLPPMQAGVLDSSNSGYFSNSALPAFFEEIQAFLLLCNKDIAGVAIGEVGVFSRTDSVIREAIQVTIDAKFDSQRRRENRETAGYLQASLV